MYQLNLSTKTTLCSDMSAIETNETKQIFRIDKITFFKKINWF